MSTRTLGHRPTFDLTTRSAPVCTSASAISHYRFYLIRTRSALRGSSSCGMLLTTLHAGDLVRFFRESRAVIYRNSSFRFSLFRQLFTLRNIQYNFLSFITLIDKNKKKIYINI